MKKIIEIAFSALNLRLLECEKKVNDTQKQLLMVQNSLSMLSKQIDEALSLSKSSQYKDELEEYKFGE